MRENAGAAAPGEMATVPSDQQPRKPEGKRPARLRASRGFALGLLLSISLWGLLLVLVRGLLSWLR